MKQWRGIGLLSVMILSLWANALMKAQPIGPTNTPTSPPPGVVLPTPTPVPPTILLTNPLPLPDLQPISRENVSALQEIFSVQCRWLGMEGYNPEIYDLEFSPTEARLVVIANDLICIYDLDNPEARPVTIDFRRRGSMVGGFFSLDGQSFYTVNGEGHVRQWNPVTGEELPTDLKDVSVLRTHQNLALSPDGTLLATGADRQLHLWDAASGDPLVTARVGRVTAVVWNRDGSRLATIEEGRVGLYTLYDGPRMFRDELLTDVHKDAGLGFGGPNGDLLAYTAPAQDGVIVRNVTTGEIVAEPEIVSTNLSQFFQQMLLFSPADPLLLVGSSLDGYELWDVESNRHLWDYNLNPMLYRLGPRRAAFNSNGTLLVFGVGEIISVWGVPA